MRDFLAFLSNLSTPTTFITSDLSLGLLLIVLFLALCLIETFKPQRSLNIAGFRLSKVLSNFFSKDNSSKFDSNGSSFDSERSTSAFYNESSTTMKSTSNLYSRTVFTSPFKAFGLFRPSEAKSTSFANNTDFGSASPNSSYSTSQAEAKNLSSNPSYETRTASSLKFTSLHEHVRHEYLFQLMFRAGLFLFERVAYYIKN